MIAVEEHQQACLASAARLPAAEVPVLDALDLLLDEDVTSAVDLPAFDNSSMDGYAVRVADLAGAGEDAPVVLPVGADVPAGLTDRLVLAPGTAARIMTGAPVPEGTQAVVPVEWTDAGTTTVAVRRVPDAGAYVRRVAEDVSRGELVLPRGVRLSPRHLSLAAAVGRGRLRVVPRPRVVVVSTGSELVPPGEPLRHGQIHDSNGYGLAAAAAELGCPVRRVGAVADDPPTFLAVLREVVEEADVVVTSGGVSAGAYEVVKDSLAALGTVTFTKVAMQPGMPQGHGTLDAGGRAVPIFTLPGNPVSSMVSFELFVRPVLRAMAGEEDLLRPVVRARAARGWTSPPHKRQYARAVLADGPDGPTVEPVGGQGSHLVADLAGAQCLAVVPEEVTAVRAGDAVECLLLDRVRR